MADQFSQRAASRREALLSMLTGAFAEPAAGVAGLYGLATGGVDRGVQNIEATRNALTYQPRDPQAMQAMGRALSPLTERYDALRQGMGDAAMGRTGSPGLATAAYMIPDAAMTLLGARMSGLRGPSMAQMAQRSAGPSAGSPAAQRGAIGAWHGSPHDFDQFDMSKLGTGEGAQAYGHGLYFAGDKGVAQGYQKALGRQVRIDGETSVGKQFSDYLPAEKAATANYIAINGYDKAAALKAIKKDIRESVTTGDRVYYQDLQKKVKAMDFEASNGGRLYDVELSPDEGDLLDWDAPLSQQPEKVRGAIDKLLEDHGDRSTGFSPSETGRTLRSEIWPDMTGGDLMRTLKYLDKDTYFGPKFGAQPSQMLNERGIPGLRYLDGTSRNLHDLGIEYDTPPTRNYVMFDDKSVKIRSKK